MDCLFISVPSILSDGNIMPVLQVAAALAKAFSHHGNFMIDIAAKSPYLVAGMATV